MFQKNRLEALSDAVVAIAMTLLIIEIKVPVDVQPGQLAAAVGHEGAQWFSFGITFFLGAVFWTLQHRVFDALTETSRESVIFTFLFLCFITTLPFSTALLGHYIKDKFAVDLYFANQLAISLPLTAKLELARLRQLTGDPELVRNLRMRLYSLNFVFLVALIATPYEPPSNIWIAPFAAVLISRSVQTLVRRRWKAAAK